MADKSNFTEKLKEGVSVEEIEKFTIKYTNELFVVVALIVATISAMAGFFLSGGWSLLFAGLAAILAFCFSEVIAKKVVQFFRFLRKQEKTTQIVLGIVRIIVAIFLPLLIFAMLGTLAGLTLNFFMKKEEELKKQKSFFEELKSSEEEHP